MVAMLMRVAGAVNSTPMLVEMPVKKPCVTQRRFRKLSSDVP